ncbi:hypothetical protein SAMN05216464_113110 [Mucilaginibacter pineti]|uniref:TerB family tellurite resistance protein n=1 Tax=Mucilaginibacter pineti TaxID=1391627 RepID=A0A1G7IPV0_9SPHI|nr:hypothetical protein [Mucilaginibacter pineti]SDF14574.1 hypothetical protein SAMN05216464_113110 [Mucilaginibacter pineti]
MIQIKKILCPVLGLACIQFLTVRPANAQNIGDLAMQLYMDGVQLAAMKSTLTELRKGFQIVSNGYGNVKNISKGNFDVHKTFLDGLMAVSPAVRKYYKVREIADDQIRIVSERKQALQRIRESGNFNPQEISYISGVYENLVIQSLQNLDDLIMVTTAGKLRMSDDERLKSIDRIHASMQDKVAFMQGFGNDTRLVSFQRERAKLASATVSGMHGIVQN